MEGADRPVNDRLAPTGTEWRTNMCITVDKLEESYGKATPRERFRLIYNVYSDDFGQAFYFKTDNSRMKNGQPSGFRNTALCITKPARNQGFGGEAPMSVRMRILFANHAALVRARS